MKLTEGIVSKLRPEPGRRDRVVTDDDTPGLHLRIDDGGSRSFFFRRMLDGARIFLPLGAPTLKDARLAAAIHNGKIVAGQNPAQERVQRRQATKEKAETPGPAPSARCWTASLSAL